MSSLTKNQYTTFYSMETRWFDEDMLGHINHGTAVAYFEDARVRHAADLGLKPYNKIEFPFIVASMRLEYLKQIKHPEELTIGLKISRIGGKSFDYQYGLFVGDDNDPSIECFMTLVCFDFEKQQTVPVFDTIKKELNK